MSNACGTLWNFSARCKEDQERLRKLGAIPMLKALTESKHKTIATCASAALKNLTGNGGSSVDLRSNPSLHDPNSREGTPSLEVRRMKNRVLELDDKLTEIEQQEDSSEEEEGNKNNIEQHDQYRLAYTSPARPGPSSEAAYFASNSYENGASSNRPALQLSKSKRTFFMKPDDTAEDQGFSSHKSFDNVPSQMFNNYVGESNNRFGEASERIMSASHLYQHSFQDQTQDDEVDERPTDYSAQFKDDNEDQDLEERDANNSNESMNEENKQDISDEQVEGEDTVKTYCTEGTPFDTPGIISTATSMSDIRETRNVNEAVGAAKPIDRQHEIFTGRVSGIDTPLSEKPVPFYTEDTPGYFSRADSLSSLDSVGTPEEPRNLELHEEVQGEVVEKGEMEARNSKEASPAPSKNLEGPSATESQAKVHQGPGLTKGVSFNPHDTPMMFSRTSSFESLNSFYQHKEFVDGYSSCDFSRTTTRPVSPSDLPDSPCQTRPQSPKRAQQPRNNNAFSQRKPLKGEGDGGCFPPIEEALDVTGTAVEAAEANNDEEKKSGTVEGIIKSSGEEDSLFRLSDERVKVYGDEGTPGVFSSKTSLSKLTFSDDDHEEKQKEEESHVIKVSQIAEFTLWDSLVFERGTFLFIF